MNSLLLKLTDHALATVFDPQWFAYQIEGTRAAGTNNADFLNYFREIAARRLVSPHPLFDAAWYVDQNSEARLAREDGVDPFTHFVLVGSESGFWPHPLFDVGWYKGKYGLDRHQNALFDFVTSATSEDRSTHPLFDAAWYRRLHVDPSTWRRQSILHFIMRGLSNGYQPNPWSKCDPLTGMIVVGKRPYKLSRFPLVSIIITNLNGESLLSVLLPSLLRQSYQKFEIILVDNASTDASVEIFRQHLPDGVIVSLPENCGFAEANNIGLRQARGELIALLNNDTKVSDAWLEELVHMMQSDVNIGAVCPKIRFMERFVALRLRSKTPFALVIASVTGSLAYKKIIFDLGKNNGETVTAFESHGSYLIDLKIAAQHERICFGFDQFGLQCVVECITDCSRIVWDLSEQSPNATLILSKSDLRNAFHVINNAGSIEIGWAQTSDRGMGAPDTREFDRPDEVDLLCGCSVLIRRDALLGRDLFIKDFVAYYEDSELALRLRRSGFKIGYCPDAVVYHQHSATTVERSPFWLKQVLRNRQVYRYLLADRFARADLRKNIPEEFQHQLARLKENANTAEERVLLEILPGIARATSSMISRIDDGDFHVERRPRVGIFNQYWMTLGGGEAHALAFANYFADHFDVELISIDDFEVEVLLEYFNLQPKRYIKRLVSKLEVCVTAEYDIFINASYMNECESRARYSFFIVHFPSRTPSRRFTEDYLFLADSQYTLGWIKRYWGETPRTTIIYPSVRDSLIPRPGETTKKQKIILSVGRFFSRGHSKNQVEIAKCFRQLCASIPAARGWRLVLIGSAGDESDDYLAAVRAEVVGLQHEILVNAPFETLRQYYRRAAIYVHAAGFGKDSEKEPADFEHFGMTVAEAAVNGCHPIVFDAAGPKEVTELLGFGSTYRTLEGLVARLEDAILGFEDLPHAAVLPAMHEKLKLLTAQSLRKRLEDIFKPAIDALVR